MCTNGAREDGFGEVELEHVCRGGKGVGGVVEDGLFRRAAGGIVRRCRSVAQAGEDVLVRLRPRESRWDTVVDALRCLSSRIVFEEMLTADHLAEFVKWCTNICIGCESRQSFF